MTATTDDVELHPCACGCGELVPKKWARGHWARGEAQKRNLHPLPGPDDDIPDNDEDLPADLVAELEELDRLKWIDEQVTRDARAAEEPEELEPDPPPGKIPPPRVGSGPNRARRQARVTATIQRDVQAKIRMVLKPTAEIWAIRDEYCGVTFRQQEPEISEALAEIVCGSPDLLNWFTGPAGGYMKYFKLFMAVQPVAVMLWMHHVAHAERQAPADGQAPPQMASYAA